MKLLLAALLSILLVACASATEELSEQLVENVAGVDNLEIDEDSGQVSFETDEGSVSIGGGDVPEGLPFQPPSGGDVMTSFVAGDSVAVTLSYDPDRFDSLSDDIQSYVDSSGEEYQTSTSTYDLGDGVVQRASQWTGPDWFFSLSDCYTLQASSDGYDAVCMTMSTTN